MTNIDKVNKALKNASEDKIKEVLDFLGYKEDGKFIPTANGRYWFITMLGTVDYHLWDNDSFDNYQLSIGNVYGTREEARLALSFRTRKAKLLKEIEDSSEALDWEDIDQPKHSLYYQARSNALGIGENRTLRYHGDAYTTNKQFLRELIKERSNEVKELLFNIRGE